MIFVNTGRARGRWCILRERGRTVFGSSMKVWLRNIVLALLVAGSGSAWAEDTVLTVWGMAITPDEKGADVQVRQFERENPGIKVRLLGMGAGGMNPQKLMTAIVGGAPPDLVRQDRFTIADWASRGAFRPLDDLIARDQGVDPRTPTAEQYYPSTWEEASYEGKVYGIPIGADNRVLHWNPGTFAKKERELRAAGLDPTRPPRTWSETLAYSKVLTEFNADGTIKTAGFMPNYGNSWLYIYGFQNNASFMSADGRRCTLNTPATAEALAFMVEGYKLLGGYDNAKKFESGFRGGENDPFATGQVAMVINGDWQLSNYARFMPRAQLKTAPAPVPDDRFYKRGRFADEEDTFVTWAGGYSWVIPKGAKNTEAAWKFMKWVTSLEGRKVYLEGQADLERARGRKYIPRMEAHIEANQWVRDQFAGDPTNQYDAALRMHIDMMPYARIRPATFVGQKLWDEHIRAFENAAREAMTVEEALKDSEKNVQALLDEAYYGQTLPSLQIGVPVAVALVLSLAGLGGYVGCLIRRGEGKVSKEETKAGYLFISPWILGFVIFTLGPMVASLVFAFMQYDVLNEAKFVGFANFQDVFTTNLSINLKAFWNVAYLAVVGIPLGLVTGLSVALLLNTGVHLIRFYRTAFYLPSITPAVATVFLWLWILNPDNSRGLVNNLWMSTIYEWFGVGAPGWWTAEAWAKPFLIVMGLWGAGSGMILWLAGLKGVPTTLYEAASLDGASGWKQFWKVTLPQISPLLFFNSVIAFIGVLQIFDQVYIATRGENMGPNDSLATPVYLLFVNGFSYFRMGYASALAWVIFLVVVLVTLIQFKVAPRWVHYEVDQK